MKILRDIKGGDFTYGERIALGRLLAQEKSEYQLIKGVIEILHEVEITPDDALNLREYVATIIEDFGKWLERENTELHIEPTPEEVQAGVDKLSKACGDMGVVVSLAEKYQCSFEQVYKMPYVEVFTIQKVGVERQKFERRLNEVYRRKK